MTWWGCSPQEDGIIPLYGVQTCLKRGGDEVWGVLGINYVTWTSANTTSIQHVPDPWHVPRLAGSCYKSPAPSFCCVSPGAMAGCTHLPLLLLLLLLTSCILSCCLKSMPYISISFYCVSSFQSLLLVRSWNDHLIFCIHLEISVSEACGRKSKAHTHTNIL